MADIRFVQRRSLSPEDITATPRLGWIFQEYNPGLLYSGSIRIDDGFVTDENGHTTTYALVRPLAFFDPDEPTSTRFINPGDLGMRPLGFRLGRVSIVPPQVSYDTILLTSSPTHQWLGGRVTMVGLSSLGSLTEFAIWGATQSDPKDFYVESATDVDSGGVTQQYTRMNAVFIPHRNARYLGVGSRIYSVPNSGAWRNHYFKKWMVEKAAVGSTVPSAKYGKAREVVVKVKPDRLNYMTNPGFELDANNYASGGGAATRTVSTARAAHGAQSLLLTSTTAHANMEIFWNTAVPLAEGPWSISWYVWSPIARTVSAYHEKSGIFKKATNVVRVPPEQWTRVHFVLNNPVRQTFNIWFTHTADASQPVGSIMHMDSILLERGETLRDYFDGSWSADTMWETGGTVGRSRSYLYKNRAERYSAIKRVLEDNVPLGIGIAEPQFATLPAD